ncbi:MAG: Na/Pi cotransporter family protein [Elusimicrobiales bacterium]|nr:Na/Pi cotransporter family protein [Elusimicrobiales bacterium]
MTIFNLFTLCGGLAFFLYGMGLLSSSLEKFAGGKMEKLLQQMTASPIKGLLLGAGITIAVQSSSAVTVMLVGMVNSGIMTLSQSVGVIMGSNVGTTATAWILSLSGIESSSFFVSLMKPEAFSPLLALAGVIMGMASKKSRIKNAGSILIGFAILMSGMEMMKNAMSPLADMPEFGKILTMFRNPLLGILAGTVITAVIQSSAASVGILQALSLTGGISYAVAFPIIMGQNIGTCSSSLISAIGSTTSGKRVSAVHILFNILGTAIFIAAFLLIKSFLPEPVYSVPMGADIEARSFPVFFNYTATPFSIAVMHSIFNIGTTMLLFPFSKLIEKLAVRIVKPGKNQSVLIDENLLRSPSFALSECHRLVSLMAAKTAHNFIFATKLLKNFHQLKYEDIESTEKEIDEYEDKLSSFLLKLSSKPLDEENNNRITQLLLAIGDIERIGDHAAYIAQIAEKMHSREKRFSAAAVEEIKTIVNASIEIVTKTFQSFEKNDLALATEAEPLESVIKHNIRYAKSNHVARMKEGQCTVEMGFIYTDLLNDLRRITAHCANIATCALQISESSMKKHEYNNNVKHVDNEDFKRKYQNYSSIYGISTKMAKNLAEKPEEKA